MGVLADQVLAVEKCLPESDSFYCWKKLEEYFDKPYYRVPASVLTRAQKKHLIKVGVIDARLRYFFTCTLQPLDVRITNTISSLPQHIYVRWKNSAGAPHEEQNSFRAVAIEISNACAFLWTVVSFVSVLFVPCLRYAVFLQDPAAYHTSLCLW